jgi:hypothetical protein
MNVVVHTKKEVMTDNNQTNYSKEPAEYIEKLISEFNNTISGKKLILIDINHLINMRDAIYESKHRDEINYPIYKQIYEQLQKLVNDKMILCPLTSLLIFEIDKIGNDKKRNETIEIANTLCCPLVANTFLIPLKEKINYYYKKNNECQIQDFVFTPIIMEEWGILANPLYTDSVTQKFEESNIDYKKHFFDDDLKSFLSKNNRVKYFTQAQKRHTSIYNGKSEIEKHALIRENIRSGCDAFSDLFDEFKFNNIAVASIFKNEGLGYRLTSEEIKENMKIIKEVMPFTYSLATVSTALNRDITRVSNENDFVDINNCCLSPYFDYFFTEKFFSNLLKQGGVGLEKEYNIVIEHKPEAILSHLNSMG